MCNINYSYYSIIHISTYWIFFQSSFEILRILLYLCTVYEHVEKNKGQRNKFRIFQNLQNKPNNEPFLNRNHKLLVFKNILKQ